LNAFGLSLVLCALTATAAVAGSAGRTDLSAADARRVKAVTAPTADFSKPEPFESLPAGAATSRKLVNHDAFSQSLPNLSFKQELDFKLGNALFRKTWVSAPSSTQASDGLGPLFNSRACQNCHLKDGRGHPPAQDGSDADSMFLRLSVPARTPAERKALAEKKLLLIPEPVYGTQLQGFAVPGLPSEGRMVIDYTEVPVSLAGGEVISLRKPRYRIEGLNYGPIDPQVVLSPRVTPQMIGLGLVEQIPASDILAHADSGDADEDGISGKPNTVRAESGEPVLGRFGWKASVASVKAQTASAFSGDIGISTPAAPDPWGDCTPAQAACRAAPSGVQKRLGDTEAPDPVLALVTFYSQNLAVPARRDVDDPEVLSGKEAFYQAGCAACHVPKYVTRRDAPNPAHRFQLIWPYSDFLLHDMGEGLADGQTVGDANGNEWRTPPLWGIGLTETVSGHTNFLHDGRARNLLEAILWHGGEAQKARDAVAGMAKARREALIRFLESL
jgi:CxxC motif-containing protein (DUF1111 family)